MPAYDFDAPRLFVDAPLAAGAVLPLDRGRANYLLNVMRLKAGAPVLVFNGRDGEWRATIAADGRKSAELHVDARVRRQTATADLHYLFAPLKHARLDYMVQKATEMGASRLIPVITRRTQVGRVNQDRMRANAIEAAEQCGILTVPDVEPERDLDRALAALEPERLLVFCDEAAEVEDPCAALRARAAPGAALAVLVGPEGGFAPEERRTIAARRNAVSIALGPRILRADTAAVAALAVVQAAIGDWRGLDESSGTPEAASR